MYVELIKFLDKQNWEWIRNMIVAIFVIGVIFMAGRGLYYGLSEAADRTNQYYIDIVKACADRGKTLTMVSGATTCS